MAWIKFEKDLLTDPRVLRIATTLEARYRVMDNPVLYGDDDRDPQEAPSNARPLPGVTLVCGALVRIWCLADTHVDEEDSLPLGFEEIDRLIGIPDFCALMPPEWIEYIDEHNVKLPNYHGHNGTEAKRKAVTQKRVAAFRARNAQALPDQTKTRPRPEKKNGAIALPDWLPKEAWSAWLEVRSKVRAPNTHRALSLAVNDLDRLRGEGEDPKAVLEAATMKGWRGLFPVNQKKAATPIKPPPNLCAYCLDPATGATNGYRHCSKRECFDKGMAGERPNRMPGLVAKPVAGG